MDQNYVTGGNEQIARFIRMIDQEVVSWNWMEETGCLNIGILAQQTDGVFTVSAVHNGWKINFEFKLI